jgi:hypothetical protein
MPKALKMTIIFIIGKQKRNFFCIRSFFERSFQKIVFMRDWVWRYKSSNSHYWTSFVYEEEEMVHGTIFQNNVDFLLHCENMQKVQRTLGST